MFRLKRKPCPACDRDTAYVNWSRFIQFVPHHNPKTGKACKGLDE